MKDGSYRFSIIIPVYKTEKELSRCVESVLMQNFSDFEIILIDDGSPDQSGTICDDFVSSDERIHCVHQKNKGVSAARNEGIKLANGEYILFLDSDDKWNDSTALSQINNILKKNPRTELLCFGYTSYDTNGNVLKIRIPYKPKENPGRDEIIRHLVYHYQYYNAAYVKAIKRNFLIENNLFFEEGIFSEDIGWSGRLLMCAKQIDVFSSAFYSYIIRKTESITSSIEKKNLVDILNQIDDAVKSIENLKEDNEKALYYEYWAYQYSMILGDVPRIKNKDDYEMLVSRCRKNTFLLKYNHQKKVRIVSWLDKIIGLRGTMLLLMFYIKFVWR